MLVHMLYFTAMMPLNPCWIALPSLNIEGRCLILQQLDKPCFADAHGKSAPFWVNMEEGWIEEGNGGELKEGENKRRGYGQDVK